MSNKMTETASKFPSTRERSLRSWQDWRPQALNYGRMRNHVVLGHPHVTRLSPSIRHRLLLGDELIRDLLAEFEWGTVEKLIQEIRWRDYWKGWLELRPQVWARYRQEVPWLRETLAESMVAEVRRVEEGRSGVAIMDRFARELVETGYLHNHARMWFASFWIHVRGLPWQLGADFFHRHLLDADAASNTLSWRWVAGLQTKGKTYLVRRSNVESYCAREWLVDETGMEELADEVVCARVITEDLDLSPQELREISTDLPENVTGLRLGLWLHEEDLLPEASVLASLPFVSVRAFLNEPGDESALRRRYTETALADGLTRAAEVWGCEALSVPTAALNESMVEWAAAEKLDGIVTLAPFVGPVRDRLPGIESILAARGIRWIEVRRVEDARLLPKARRGFFPFWQEVSRDMTGR